MAITTIIKNIRDYDADWFNEAFESLSLWRKERSARIKAAHARNLSILAGHMLKEIIISEGQDPENVEFGPQGKPILKGSGPSLLFSLSHSEDAVLVSYIKYRENGLRLRQKLLIPSIGADIEHIRKYDERLSARFFSEEEQKYLKFSDARDEMFTRIWTTKEAYGKFTGGGISDGLKFSVFSTPVEPLNLADPCFFEHSETVLNDVRYLYTVCSNI